MANEQNLIKRPPFTPEEASRFGKIGAIKSAEARRKKKTMRAVYLDFLAEKICVEIPTGEGKRGKKKVAMTGEELLKYGIQKAITKGTAEALRLAKELREGIDGKPKKQIDINQLLK